MTAAVRDSLVDQGMRLTDAHFHADDLAGRDPSFAGRYRLAAVRGVASVHSAAGLAATGRAMAAAGPYQVSFGIHPQAPRLDESGLLEDLVAGRGDAGPGAAPDTGAAPVSHLPRRLAAIGECGFDFMEDAYGMARTPANLRAQTEAFEFQLALAGRAGLPMVLHLRRANDLLFAYARRLARLPALVLHSWCGPANEALDFLVRCPLARFSFGTGILNGNKKARATAAALPVGAILAETDAPWQPPREAPRPGARLVRPYSTIEDLATVVGALAGLRGVGPEAMADSIAQNFQRVFGTFSVRS